jgi:murein DD-endopeptidase MepM/ murein hydrolase activator NlpD
MRMPELRVRMTAIITAIMLVVITHVIWSSARRRALRDEVRWLRARLADKQDLIGRQRREIAEVASAVDRVVHAGSIVRERASEARRLAHMEESREPLPGPFDVRATLDGEMAPVSEKAAQALEQLASLEGQATTTGDSLTVLTVLLKSRPDDPQQSVPTLWPVRGAVTSRFGKRPSPYGDGTEHHPGIDIRARHGLPVTASGDAEVVFAGRDPGYGGLVILRHGAGIDTLYAHLSAIYVRAGQSVRRGQPVGAVGATGRATGAHLHYEVRVQGAPVDPRRFLVN